MIQFSYYTLSLVMLISIVFMIRKGQGAQILIRNIIMFQVGWLAYIFVLTRLGWLESFAFPPRIPALIILPVAMTMIVLTRRTPFKDLLSKLPTHYLIYIQSFRIAVELLIYGTFLSGLLPQRVTFEGINFDILVGVSALPIGYLVQTGRIGKKGALAWNFTALSVLALTVYSFISTFYFSDLFRNANNFEFVQMPYILLAAILLPCAVFFHILSIRQWVIK